MGVLDFSPEEAARKMNKSRFNELQGYIRSSSAQDVVGMKEVTKGFKKYRKLFKKLPKEFDKLKSEFRVYQSVDNLTKGILARDFCKELRNNGENFVTILEAKKRAQPERSYKTAVSWMRVPDEVQNRIFDKVGKPYGELVREAAGLNANKGELEAAIKEISKELVKKTKERGIYFEYSDETIDSANTDEVYNKIVSRVKPGNLYSNGVDKAVNAGLWTLFFFPIGLVKAVCGLVRGGARKGYHRATKAPSNKDLLRLKNAAEFFYDAYKSGYGQDQQ